ncbi:DUF397 domain-containing protein [Spirillospora sp. NPDC029432]|uniref:DUF397 domain-containing protein n=1 Tax=Spirillospora sp. NPDC029432 TaxID=3154599 RepID=UPI003451904C
MSPVWRKSRRSGSDPATSDCVEVADLAGSVGVRDSKNADGARLVFGSGDWAAFARRVKNGEHDLT